MILFSLCVKITLSDEVFYRVPVPILYLEETLHLDKSPIPLDVDGMKVKV